MVESFPIILSNQSLVAVDFLRFSQAFSEILLRKMVTAKRVDFVIGEEQLKILLENISENIDELLILFQSVCENLGQCIKYQDVIMMPFALNEGEAVVAIFTEVDPLFNKRVSDNWLSGIQNEVRRDFLLLKQARIDEQTGLFNLSNLYSLLDNPSANKPVQLIVLEISGKSVSSQSHAKHLRKCVSGLQKCIPDRAVIHYLGSFIFAVLFEFQDENDNLQPMTSLVASLKEEGFSRIYAGSSHDNRTESDKREGAISQHLLEEAWTALRVAAKRGPFGFCDFSLLAHPENHPLLRPDNKLIRRFRRLWKKSECFCIVQFRSDDELYTAREIIKPFLHQGTSIEYGSDLIVYLEGDKKNILSWTESVVKRCRDVDAGKTVSAGIGSYPFCDFKKSEIPYNCLKALAHAAFFGNSGVALFDSVSLNISGDIYFSDGDLVKAVKEYSRGLKCDGDSVNLHNSLGVTFALMNRFPAAMQCFKKALEIDGNNFMALYNKGLGELNNRKKKEAISCFKSALDCDLEEEAGILELRKDLKRQIGVLLSEIGSYQDALEYLLPWYDSSIPAPQAESVFYYIGKSYYGLEQSKEAMRWLQRALRFNEYDDRAMNLLGRIYYEEGEGDEIALSLCQKSVELDPDNSVHRLELAKLQLHCEIFPAARDNLKQCLKNQELRAETQIYLAECYLKIGHLKRAAHWFHKTKKEN